MWQPWAAYLLPPENIPKLMSSHKSRIVCVRVCDVNFFTSHLFDFFCPVLFLSCIYISSSDSKLDLIVIVIGVVFARSDSVKIWWYPFFPPNKDKHFSIHFELILVRSSKWIKVLFSLLILFIFIYTIHNDKIIRFYRLWVKFILAPRFRKVYFFQVKLTYCRRVQQWGKWILYLYIQGSLWCFWNINIYTHTHTHLIKTTQLDRASYGFFESWR